MNPPEIADLLELATPWSFVNAASAEAPFDRIRGKSVHAQHLVAGALAPRQLDVALRDPEMVGDEGDQGAVCGTVDGRCGEVGAEGARRVACQAGTRGPGTDAHAHPGARVRGHCSRTARSARLRTRKVCKNRMAAHTMMGEKSMPPPNTGRDRRIR